MAPPPWFGSDPPLHPNLRGVGTSPTVAINELCDRLRHEGRTVAKLGLGQSPFPVPMPVVEALRLAAPRKDYLQVKGLPQLRAAVAEYHRRVSGSSATEDDVMVGPGSKELMFLLQVAYEGELVVPTPAWVSYAPQAHILGRRVRFLHTRGEDGWKVRPEDVERLCHEDRGRPRVMILNYPSNPTGATYGDAELADLAAVVRTNRVVILSDEIYGELHHRGAHTSIARHYPEGTIVSSGLSKWCGAGGWRLGTFAFPPSLRWLQNAMAAVASETYTSTSAPIQYAAVRAFQGGIEIERYLRNARRILAALAAALLARLAKAPIEVKPPAGAFYLFPNFAPAAARLSARGVHTSDELCRRLLEDTGVAILPGSAFGRPPEELTARLAYVDFDGARALAAAEIVPPTEPVDDDFVRRHCGSVVDAVDRMCAWTEA